jgi:hypothetical protein
MLVLSDMSGPSMQPGFDEYLTAYPLPGTDLFVFARTWYAPEMQRPGCVWTHSLLIHRSNVARVPITGLLGAFRRPQLEGVDSVASRPVEVDEATSGDAKLDGFTDRGLAASVIGAVLGQPRPVIVAADTAAQFEPVFLRLWEELWPAERTRFSFCSGALMPRSNAGALLDLQAVPRALSPSQFRKSANAALVLDLRAPTKPETWVESILDGAARRDATFRTWLEAAAGADAGRAVVPSLAPIFGAWHAQQSSAQSLLASIVSNEKLEPSVRSRLIGMAFDRADMEAGATRRRELLQDACEHFDFDPTAIAPALEAQTQKLFEQSRADGIALVLSLVGSELIEIGERVLRAAVLLLVPNDIEKFGDAQAAYLPTIVGANPALASSPALWNRLGSRSSEVLSMLAAKNPSNEERGTVVDSIIASSCDVPADAVVRFGGKAAIFRALAALTAGQIQLSWPWRSAISAQPDAVLDWLEGNPSLTPRELDFGTRFLSPKTNPSRLTKVWQTGTASGAGAYPPRVAAFGLALGLTEGTTRSPLLATCFQPTYDAAASSRLEYEEWDWLRDLAPPVSWWRDWDKCERLAAALARLIKQHVASVETFFGIVRSRQAVKKIADILDDDRDSRLYLKSLRKAAKASSSIGAREQRDALLEDW